jgi:hypothetical protein
MYQYNASIKQKQNTLNNYFPKKGKLVDVTNTFAAFNNVATNVIDVSASSAVATATTIKIPALTSAINVSASTPAADTISNTNNHFADDSVGPSLDDVLHANEEGKISRVTVGNVRILMALIILTAIAPKQMNGKNTQERIATAARIIKGRLLVWFGFFLKLFVCILILFFVPWPTRFIVGSQTRLLVISSLYAVNLPSAKNQKSMHWRSKSLNYFSGTFIRWAFVR